MNDRVKMTGDKKTLARSRGQRTDKSWCTEIKEERIDQRERF